ncbi:NAD-dependent epimerase/dehydratase family protein [candidate division KSB1 bacterium]|nr:NAD-dependent epimerase/dehydratase family protein [candidate division KSB1 bacterium]
MKILVTGANGFVGSHLAARLLGLGHQVVCLVREQSNLRWIQHLALEFRYGEITRKETLKGQLGEIDAMMHVAGITKARNSETYNLVNVSGTQNIVEICLEENPTLKRFVFLSSQSAAGPARDKESSLTEDSEPRPITWYGESKLKAEELVTSSLGPKTTIVRPGIVYGPRERDVFAFFKFVNRGYIPLLDEEPRYFNLIYIDDLINFLIMILEDDRTLGETYFLTDGKPHTWDQMGLEISIALEKDPARLFIPRFIPPLVAFFAQAYSWFTRQPVLLNKQKIKEMKERFWLCSSQKAQDQLGFTPQFSIRIGIKKTAEWYLVHGWLKAE